MYIMYVDESGDPGVNPYSSHFILVGLVVSVDHWDTYLDRLKKFRKSIKTSYKLNQRTEIHTAELIRVNKLEEYKRIRKADRIKIIQDYCSEIPNIFDTGKIISICIDKNQFESANIFELAWNRLIQRFDNHLKKDCKSKGIIITDDTQSKNLQNLLRKMKVYNPITSKNSISGAPFYYSPVNNIIEDPFPRSSSTSYFIQSADLIAHMLYRKEYIKGSLKKYRLEMQFDKFEPILLKAASKTDNYGIVRK